MDAVKNNKKKMLSEFEQLNIKFINSLRTIVEPFIRKLEVIHKNNVDLNDTEKAQLRNSIDLLKMYSQNEAKLAKFFENRGAEQKILFDINQELVIIMDFAKAAEKGKFDILYSDCEKLQRDLLDLEQNLEQEDKSIAA